MSGIAPTPEVNAAIATARDLPDLVHKLERVDPAAAEQLAGKALVASRTVYGGVATIAVTWLVGRYNLGWGADVVSLVAGGAVIVGLRIYTSAPIASLLGRLSPHAKGTPP
jgi:hypothetical protein